MLPCLSTPASGGSKYSTILSPNLLSPIATLTPADPFHYFPLTALLVSTAALLFTISSHPSVRSAPQSASHCLQCTEGANFSLLPAFRCGFPFLVCLLRFAEFAHEARKFLAAFLGNVDLLNPNATTPGSNPLESILYAIPEACNVACTARSLTSPLPKQ